MGRAGFNLVLSRKGFDSSTGGCASPVFPNQRLYSLPIPFPSGSQRRYCDINTNGGLDGSDMGTVVNHLTAGRIASDAFAHLDPDIDEGAAKRLTGWRGSFGQVGGSQKHLEKQGVGVGDVFLFHGWFRDVCNDHNEQWSFQPRSPHRSIIFGWLQIGEVIDLRYTDRVKVIELYPWLSEHPHLHFPTTMKTSQTANTIYIASDRLILPGVPTLSIPGAGVFRAARPPLVLTATAVGRVGRSCWRLPRWFKGDASRPWPTQFPRSEWWTDDGDADVLLRPKGRQGQEAVLNCADRPEAGPWIASLFG